MTDKEQILTRLKAKFKGWEELLNGMSEEQINTPPSPLEVSIKDVIAHLMAWQQVSIARLEAAQRDKEPVFPDWLAGAWPESEEDREDFNTRIYDIYHVRAGPDVLRAWREGFMRFLSLGEAIPEQVLMEKDRYPWLKGYALIALLKGSYEHHQEHLEKSQKWLSEHGKI